MKEGPNHIVFYDGDCGVCNHFVDLILKRQKSPFYFAQLEGDFAADFFQSHDQEVDLETIHYFVDGTFHKRGEALACIAKRLKFPFNMLQVIRFFPRFVQRFFYDLIAKNRYRLAGRKTACRIPEPEEKPYFLDFKI